MNPSNTPPESKTALLIRNAAPYDFGGAERFVVDAALELAKHGWSTTVVSHHAQIKEHAQALGVPFIRGPWLQSWQDYSGKRILLFPFFVLWQIYVTLWYIWLIKKTEADVIHPQSRDDFISATLAAHILGKRVVWTDHADLKYVYQNVSVPIKNPVGKWVWRMSRKANAITLVSNSEERLVADAAGVEKLPNNYRVVYNGVSDRAVLPVKRAEDEQNSVIYAATSRLVTAKGIGELIDAFQSIDDGLNARLWIIGDGPEAETFKKQAADNPHITFKGFQREALSYLAAADVFVHPSHHEGFSISIVEAAMLGKPMIACNVGGNPEIVHDNQNGFLVQVKNSAALGSAMLKLGQNRNLRNKFGANARSTYKQQFEFDRIVSERFLPLYEK